MGNSRTVFLRLSKRWKKLERDLPKIIQKRLVNQSKQNFRRGAFYDKKWEPRKKTDAGRALLVKSGRLKRSIRGVGSPTMNDVTIGTDVKHGKYHNEGTKHIPQRQFMGDHPEVRRMVKREVEKALKNLFKR